MSRRPDLNPRPQVGSDKIAGMPCESYVALAIDNEGAGNSDHAKQILDSAGRVQRLPEDVPRGIPILDKIITRARRRLVQADHQKNDVLVRNGIDHIMKIGE